MSNLRQQILATKDEKIKKINVPEWDVEVHVKELSVREQTQYEQDAFDGDKIKPDFYVRYLIKAMVDENGAPIFDVADYAVLAEKNANVLLRIFKEATTLEVKKAKN